jgi:hypothetical protein
MSPTGGAVVSTSIPFFMAKAGTAATATNIAATTKNTNKRFMLSASFFFRSRLLTVSPYEGSSPAVMSIGPELVGKKFPICSGIRPMRQDGFASRILANRSGEMSATYRKHKRERRRK